MCLCGMLAAEYQTLPPPMRDAVVGFFDINEAWLERVLDEGKAAGTLHPRGSTSNTSSSPPRSAGWWRGRWTAAGRCGCPT